MNNVTLKVQTGNVSIEVTGEQVFAEKKLEELLYRFDFSNRQPEHSPNTTFKATQKKLISHSEFLKQLTPKTQMDKALALSYYLEKYSSQESFTTSELSEACKKSKQPNFSNISDCVAKLVSQGLLMNVDDKDGARAYSLTTTGEKQIEGLLTTT